MVLPWKNRWPTEEHEAAFVARLPRICQWARQLAKQQDLADDLAQEAFIVFTGAKPDLEEIHNLDAYLLLFSAICTVASLDAPGGFSSSRRISIRPTPRT